MQVYDRRTQENGTQIRAVSGRGRSIDDPNCCRPSTEDNKTYTVPPSIYKEGQFVLKGSALEPVGTNSFLTKRWANLFRGSSYFGFLDVADFFEGLC